MLGGPAALRKLRPIEQIHVSVAPHTKRKLCSVVKMEGPAFIDYEQRLKFDSVCEKLKVTEEPFHLLSTLIELFKHDYGIMCRIMDSSPSFADAFDNPICYSVENLGLTLTLFSLILTDIDRVSYGFANAIHHMVPLLSSEASYSVAANVISAAVRGNHSLASDLIFESDIFTAILEAVTQDGGHILHRSVMAELTKLIVKRASPERLVRVKERLLHLLETLFHVDDAYIFDLCCITVTLAIGKEVPTDDIVPVGLVGHICTLHDPPKSAFGMLNAMLLHDRNCFNSCMQITTWAAGFVTETQNQKLALRFLGNMSVLPQYCQFMLEHDVVSRVFASGSEVAYQPKDDFFILFCNVAVLNPSFVASYPGVASLFQELLDLLMSGASAYLWRHCLAMLHTCVTSKNDCYRFIKALGAVQLDEALGNAALPPDVTELANLVLQSLKT